MINIVTALAEEARPIIDRFKLKRQHSCNAFPVYIGDQYQLIVSGIGVLNSAIATGFLAGMYPEASHGAWLNVGIAGAKSLPLGSAILANKVTQMGAEKSCYPVLLFDFPFRSMHVQSVIEPLGDYQENIVNDMEAAGFCASAVKFTTLELLHSCKIISDNEDSTLESFDKNTVSDLVAGQVDFIESACNQLQLLAAEANDNEQAKTLHKKIMETIHFTNSQSSQLLSLLNRWLALTGETPVFLERMETGINAKTVLARLNKEIETLPVKFEPGKR